MAVVERVELDILDRKHVSSSSLGTLGLHELQCSANPSFLDTARV